MEDKNILNILQREWHTIRNSGMNLFDENISRSKKYWWLCSVCGYEWEACISRRIGSEKKKGTGCPCCKGKVVVYGKNDLVTVAPELLKEWDYSKNTELYPECLYSGSTKKVWWICQKCDNKWQTTVSHRTHGRGCPKCATENRKKSWSETSARKNSIAENQPEVLKMWDYEKNRQDKLDPYNVSCTSKKIINWKCDVCGYEWRRKPYLLKNRTIYCPSCNRRGTSFPEQAIFYYVSQVFPDVINRFKGLEKELDIFIPSVGIAIEYDGIAWHKSVAKLKIDNSKDQMCVNNNIKLFRIRDYELPPTESADIIHFSEKGNVELDKAIKELLSRIVKDKEIPEISIKKDYEKINSCLRNAQCKNNLEVVYPNIADEWHPSKNLGLLPCHVQPGSIRRVWWKCSKCEYEWKTTINNRALHNSGCPSCASNIMVKGKNDLKTWCTNNDKQELMEEWDFALNIKEGIYIDSVAKSSHIKAWWKCKDCGNVWRADISSRTGGRGCGVCSRKRATNKRKKSIRNIDTGMIFDSVDDAISYYNLPPRCKIALVCKGERRTAGGYRWEYYQISKNLE